jgi:hypothetical protein
MRSPVVFDDIQFERRVAEVSYAQSQDCRLIGKHDSGVGGLPQRMHLDARAIP